jgi:8-oxo-dGTP diphosphatase
LKKRIEVVGAVIIRDGLILCAQRGSTAKLPGMWEFPGGKIESGESPSEALVREITEELSCVIEVDEYINTAEYEYDFGIVILSTFYCSLISGEPKLSEHDEMVWLRPDELQKLDWAPADLPAVAAIQEVATNK